MRILNGAGTPERGAVERPDLQEVLAHYGCHAMHDGKYACLVHEERNPSMNVSLREGLWYCHACGQGGSSLDLIMKIEGVDLEGAVKFAEQQDWSAVGPAPKPADEVFGRRRPGRERKARSRAWSRPW